MKWDVNKERERARERESKRERDEKRRKHKGQLHREDTSLTWRKKTSHGRLERHNAHLHIF